MWMSAQNALTRRSSIFLKKKKKKERKKKIGLCPYLVIDHFYSAKGDGSQFYAEIIIGLDVAILG